MLLLLALAGSTWGRMQENAQISGGDFLKGIVLPFKSLHTTDVALSADEISMLQPDAALVRRYSSSEQLEAELAVVVGHHKRSVHTPGFCMLGGGWDVIWQRSSELIIPTRTIPIPAMQMMMGKEGRRLLVTYFFTNGAFCTRSLLQFQGFQFLQRMHLKTPEGALVRIMIPVNTDEQSAVALASDFAQTTIPPVLDCLQTIEMRAPQGQ
jgi:EpsI family protein